MPKPAWLSHLILLIAHLKWAWDFILYHSFFQPHGFGFLREYSESLGTSTFNKARVTEESEECPVCLCRIEEDDEAFDLNCQHLFHKVCLDRWVGYGHATCPLCRNNLRPPRLAADLHWELIVIDICAARSRDDRCMWWLR